MSVLLTRQIQTHQLHLRAAANKMAFKIAFYSSMVFDLPANGYIIEESSIRINT